MKNKKFQKGIITFQMLGTIALSLSAGFGAYFGNIIAMKEAINKSEKNTMVEVSENKNEITKNSTNIENIYREFESVNKKLETIIDKL